MLIIISSSFIISILIKTLVERSSTIYSSLVIKAILPSLPGIYIGIITNLLIS